MRIKYHLIFISVMLTWLHWKRRDMIC